MMNVGTCFETSLVMCDCTVAFEHVEISWALLSIRRRFFWEEWQSAGGSRTWGTGNIGFRGSREGGEQKRMKCGSFSFREKERD
jgi:hypothetical protein